MFEVLLVTVALPLVTTFVAVERIKGSHFWWRLLFCITLDSIYGNAIYTIQRPVVTWIADRLPGASSSQDDDDDYLQHDKTLAWPPLPNANIPSEWVDLAKQRQREHPSIDEPLWFLNHVRGSLRFRQAVLRLASAAGSILMAYVMTNYVDPPFPDGATSEDDEGPVVGLASIGLTPISFQDIALGVLVGSTVVLAIFALEVALGWIRVIGYFEKVVAEESWTLNILWDVLFHIGVSINEEISMRGWILVHTLNHLSLTWEISSLLVRWLMAISLQASFFALMHATSPGANAIGLFNLVVGGTAGALNVFVTGSLSFSIGWHFGWNIWMGHLLGLSTSGIPMSAKLVSIVPHPSKADLHGGRFGPEQSPLAPLAYALGLVLLMVCYPKTERVSLVWG